MRLYELLQDVKEDNKAALVGSGPIDASGKKTVSDSPAHKKVRTPGTTYSKDSNERKKGMSVKPGANDGFVG